MGHIIDISHHQVPSAINYDKLAKQVDLVIIRTQYGSNLTDRHYKTHHREFQKRGVPTAAYAWLRGVSNRDMEVEATDFYNRTKQFNPTFWFLDVEEQSMKNMRSGVKAFAKKLRSLGAKKVGV
jgi:GH25 family lysozyme M1 (1,4-beta-N-acetylmuramidase)